MWNMIFVLFTILTSVLIVILLKVYLKKRSLNQILSNVPTVRNEWPLIGHGHWLMFRNSKQLLAQLIKLCADQETPSKCWIGSKLTIIINKPDDIKTVLMSPNCLQKPYVYDFFGSTRGLLNSPAHIWKKDRKYINRTFNNNILNSFVPIFNEKIEKLIKRLERKLNTDRAFDISKMMFPVTLEAICATTIGHDIDVERDKDQEFLKNIKLLSKLVGIRIMQVWLHPEFLFRLSPYYKSQQLYTTSVRSYTENIRKIKQKELNEPSMLKQKLQDDEEFSTPQIFVNEILKIFNEGEMTFEMLDDQILTMIITGNETTALVTSHIILMLAMHQDVQERVVNELREVYESDSIRSTTESISKLDYMEQVMKETLRLMPTGIFLARECEIDTAISNCTIPAGSMVLLDFYHLHRNVETWGPNAHRFDPENFTPEKILQRHPYTYLPFSGGSRNCVGMKYAWISMKIMLACMLRKYKFTTELKFENMTTKWDVLLKVVGGHMIKIEKRDFNSTN